ALSAPLSMVVLPSRVPRPTAGAVAQLPAPKERLPTIIGPILGALGAAVRAASDATASNDLEGLGEIMKVSHELVSALGPGHPALDRRVVRALEAGALGAKLTGAGGGGCVLALARPGDGALASTLEADGCTVLPVEIHG